MKGRKLHNVNGIPDLLGRPSVYCGASIEETEAKKSGPGADKAGLALFNGLSFYAGCSYRTASFGKVCRALLSGVILGKAIGLSDLMHKQGKSK
jgi:hypothetical protein